MSRAKIGHEFCPLPRKWYAGWAHHQGFYARGLRDALFELADGAPIPVHGSDWLSSVCSQLCVHGKDRPNVRRALKLFVADGLIGFDGEVVRGRFLPDSGPVAHRVPIESQPTPNRLPIESQSSPNQVEDRSKTGQSLPLPLESTPRNDSGRISQTDRQNRQTDHTDARAREAGGVVPIEPARKLEIEGYKWLESVLGSTPPDLGSWRREYALIASKPAAERAAVGRHAMATQYIRDKRSKANPGHLVKYWDDFVAGPRSFEFDRPATAKRFAGPSRVATAEEYAADAAGGNPWD